MKLKLFVNEDAIKHGIQGSSKSCPIALVVRGIIPNKIGVGRANVSVHNPNGHYPIFIPLPKEARDFVFNFDHRNNHLVKPFEFEIDIPEELIDEINIDDVTQPLTYKLETA